jgi:hypothetical protein
LLAILRKLLENLLFLKSNCDYSGNAGVSGPVMI